MDDLIYREAAVKALGRYHDETLKRIKDTDERIAQTLAITNCMGIINHTVETAHHDRTEENDRLNKWFLEQVDKTYSTYDEAIIGNLGVIASALMDISKSLAIIADKDKRIVNDRLIEKEAKDADN